ncbi:MAG: Ig-like domain-containing protein [Anaerolineae bacterium]
MTLNKRLFFTLISVPIIIGTLLLACRFGPRPVTMTPTPAPTSTPLPPQVIQVAPVRGEEQPLDAPVQLVFDQPMDAGAVEAAFTIEPAVGGDFEWPTARMVQFKPAGKGFERATRYTVALTVLVDRHNPRPPPKLCGSLGSCW